MSYLELLKLAAPETIVVITALAVLAADLLALRGLELRVPLASSAAMIACVGCVGGDRAGCWLCRRHAQLPAAACWSWIR